MYPATHTIIFKRYAQPESVGKQVRRLRSSSRIITIIHATHIEATQVPYSHPPPTPLPLTPATSPQNHPVSRCCSNRSESSLPL